MKYIIVVFMCVGMCLVGGNRRGGNRGVRGLSTESSLGFNTERPSFRQGKDYLASVVQLPSVYHRCSAFFVSNDILIAPATCVLCDEICQFQVATHKVSAHSTPKFVKVKKFIKHPQFIKNYATGNPSYNIAILKLAESVSGIEPLKISKTTHYKEGFIRSWTFNKQMTDFYVKAHAFQKVTHYICDESGVKVKLDEICIQGHYPIELGSFNEGTVFVIDDAIHGAQSSGVAFFTKGSTPGSKFFSFLSISFYYDWLNKTITEISG